MASDDNGQDLSSYNFHTDGFRTNATSAEVFDSQTQTWAPIASMSTERKFAMVAAVQGKLYAAGGDDVGDGAEGNVQRSVEAYDPQQNRGIR